MTSQSETKPKSGWLNVAVDYGPLLIFFLVYKLYSPESPGEDTAGEILAVIRGTGAFIVAALIALAISKFRLGKVSPMLWLSTAMIVGFGALTIYFQDERFIQWKPTIIYVLFAAVLLGGYARGKSLLKILLEAAFEGLDDEGWLKLSRNWGVFFIALAALNTALVFTVSFETWLGAKLWLFLPLTFIFTFTQVPMLMRHGLVVADDEDAAEEAIKDEPPTA
ncbi:inner membrane-spanning protein YciB [Aurantiacibacter gangjinensis]|uniref:Inner membrane-spanning protein YciB n=1 Tax=Aurantiacibacter gangjinensis TaxID=502682 RepID=A0A0G9MQV1_9SPHN|nr:inner membrane-spanning protein YciB [Aurantiacibacter gangjinensis]APE28994.1 putative intracellular septation protein [Aurantiacibacter gangjinensis]KLE33105.1 septation protein A [Aurantiacibacter gangjinensis]